MEAISMYRTKDGQLFDTKEAAESHEAARSGRKITPEKAAQKMREIDENGDTEGAHCDADELFCEILRDLGYGDAVDVFEGMTKWYA